MSQRRSGFCEVISTDLVEVSGIRRKGGRYVQGLQLRPRGPGVVDETYFSEEIVTGWRGLCEEGIPSHWSLGVQAACCDSGESRTSRTLRARVSGRKGFWRKFISEVRMPWRTMASPG